MGFCFGLFENFGDFEFDVDDDIVGDLSDLTDLEDDEECTVLDRALFRGC